MENYRMKHLLNLMEEFSILGMEPAPLDTTSGMDFMPQGEVAPEGEYELDADGNPLLDEQGNPILQHRPLAVVTIMPTRLPPYRLRPVALFRQRRVRLYHNYHLKTNSTSQCNKKGPHNAALLLCYS
jgi:hypothetical protein